MTHLNEISVINKIILKAIKKLLFNISKYLMKFYYENILANQNFTAKSNIAWVCDITEIE